MRLGLIEALELHARVRPNQVAIREVDASGLERTHNWRELRDAASRLASRLRRAGDGRVVMVVAPNRRELLATLLGALWADAAALPVDPETPPAELVEIARRVSASTLIGDQMVLDAIAEVVAEHIPIDYLARGEGGAEVPEPRGTGSLLLQSSGTTGMPKVVRRRAPALDAVGENCRRAIGVGEDDTMLLTIPLYHSYGIDHGVLTAVIAGCSIEIHGRFDPALVRAALAHRAISVMPVVPLMLDALSRNAKGGGRAPSLRRVFSAGSPLSRRIADRFRRVYGVSVGQVYGTTEFGSVTFNDPDAADFDPEKVGRPLGGVRLKILDALEPRLDEPLPPDQEGHVAVAAPSMLSDYVDSPDAPTTDDFLLTGDLGRIDASGTLQLTGRLKLLIDVGGLKVNPLEVESVLARHPAVHEVVTVPVHYSDTASRLKAIVIPEPGCELDREELARFAREHLVYYKVPRFFEIRTTVPRSPTGKILRKELLATEGRV